MFVEDFVRQFFILWMVTRGTTSVVLKDVKVPSMVRNATEPHVILDCIYSLNHSEKDGMILKWYFNGKTIFQWIPPSKPQGVGMMKGRINLDYEHSPDPYDRHRALFMHWPTTEMTGDYTCKVSTLQNDVTGTKRMTVFEPPRWVQIQRNKGHDIVESVNVSCTADHVFPEPSIQLFHGQGHNRIDLNQTHSIIEKAVQYQSGAWQKIVFVVLADKSLRVENVFECVVRLPPSPVSQHQFQPHVWKRRMVYAPSNPMVMASASNSSPAKSLCWLQFSFWCMSVLVKSSIFHAR